MALLLALTAILSFMLPAFAADLRKMEKKIEESNSGPKTEPTPTPTPQPSYLNTLEDTASDGGIADLLVYAFQGAGSPTYSLLGEAEDPKIGTFKADLASHGLFGGDSARGFNVAANVTLMRLYLAAEYEHLYQSSFLLRSTGLKIGYSLGLGSMSLAGFIGTFRIEGDYDNTGNLLGAAWTWYITEGTRTELVFDTTGFGESSLRRLTFTGQQQIAPYLFLDLGARYNFLTRSDLDYTLFFAGLRLSYD